jgi:outer membrane protein OmpA-like peptidoglycan-associated protein
MILRFNFTFNLILLFSIILSALIPLSLRSQSLPFSAVVMNNTYGRGAQTYLLQGSFPAQEIKKKWDEGFSITSVAQGNGFWGAVMTSHSGFSAQQYIVDDTFPIRRIEEQWDKNYRITAMTFGNGRWTVVLSEGSGIPLQSVFITDSFPIETIENYKKAGFRISAMNKANGMWVVVMNTQSFFITDQDYVIASDFPTDSIAKYYKSGKTINSIAQSEETWALSFNGYSQFPQQILLQEREATKEEIEKRWAAGYRITALTIKQPFNDVYSAKKQTQLTTQTVDISQLPKQSNTEAYHRYIERNAPSADAYVAVQRLAYEAIKAKNWLTAADTFKIYEQFFLNDEMRRIPKTIEMLTSKEQPITIMNLGDSINTKAGDWDPTPTPDGSTLYLTTNGRPDGSGGEDVFYSERKNGVWGKAKNIGSPINASLNETIDNVSADGNTLFLSGYFQGSFGEFDIYTAEKTATGWEALRQLPMPINSQYHDESACMSSDGKALIFTSDRPGGVGGYVPRGQFIYHGGAQGNMDVYVALKTQNGWSKPINLGTTINTPYAERSAFLHPDGKTLYFSTDGQYGLGGMDVFKSTRLSDSSWTEWSEPINIGRQINSPNDDWGYKPNVTGDTAYFAAFNREGGKGDWDIYTATIDKKAKPENLATVRGKVIDTDGKSLEAAIRWENLTTKQVVGQLKTNPRDGSFFIALPLGKNYGYFAEKEGYYSVSKSIDLRKKKENINITQNIVLTKLKELLETKKSIPINNIFFNTNEFELQQESYPELERLAAMLKENKIIKIEIAGHTDDVGNDKANLILSQNRANAVREYLIKSGCDEKIIIARGYGKKKPVNTDKTDEARAQNRRVEFRAVK